MDLKDIGGHEESPKLDLDQASGLLLSPVVSFRTHLLGVAGARLNEFDPSFKGKIHVAAASGDLSRLIIGKADELPLSESAKQRFTRYKALLNQLLQVQLSIRELRVAVVLITYTAGCSRLDGSDKLRA